MTKVVHNPSMQMENSTARCVASTVTTMPQKLLDSTIGRIKNTSEQFISIIIAQELMLHSQKYVFYIFGRKVNYLRAPFGNAFQNMDQGTHTCNPSFLFLHMCLRSYMDLACKDLEEHKTKCF